MEIRWFYEELEKLKKQSEFSLLSDTAQKIRKQKIENSQKPLSLVAEEVGYQSDSAFQKAFKRFFSYTPASLRKKINSGKNQG